MLIILCESSSLAHWMEKLTCDTNGCERFWRQLCGGKLNGLSCVEFGNMFRSLHEPLEV